MFLSKHSLFCVLLTSSFASASPISSPESAALQLRHGKSPKAAVGKAVYLISNNADNAVAAIKITANGTLGDATLTPTGGNGSAMVNAMGQQMMPDALSSQSSLTIAGQHIFAVNPGSNTVSMLAISPHDPTSLKLIGSPAILPGTFPNTVAASFKNSLVCVGTTGSKAGISCAPFNAHTGIATMDALRPFPLQQSDPPIGPLNTVSQIFFSPDESVLYTTVKGDPTTNKTGFLSVFLMDTTSYPAKLSTQDTRSSPAGTAVLFGSQPIPHTQPPQIFATDASFGAAILTLSPSSHTASLTANQTIAGQQATCWSTISPYTHTAFVTDAALDRIVEMRLSDASIVGIVDLSMQTRDPGLIDLKAAGRFLYALSPGNGSTEAEVVVVDVGSRGLVQRRGLGVLGVKGSAQGMAVLV